MMASIFKVMEDGLVLGTEEDDIIRILVGDATIEGLGGADMIRNIIGHNHIYGDYSVVVSAVITDPPTVGDVDTSINGDADIPVPNETFTYHDDKIMAGKGDDIVAGDIGDLDIIAMASDNLNVDEGNSTARLANKTFVMGDDEITGGLGEDEISGDVRVITMAALAGMVSLESPLGPDGDVGRAVAILQDIELVMGDDYIDGGIGDDVLSGDAKEYNISIIGKTNESEPSVSDPPTALAGNSTAALNLSDDGEASDLITFTAGADHISGGMGSDEIFGDLGLMNIVLQADDTVYGGSSAARLIGQTFKFGEADVVSDTLLGGKGDDHIYGDIGTFLLSSFGGTIPDTVSLPSFGVFQNGEFSQNKILLSADHIMGDEGDDHLYGDIGLLKIADTPAFASPDALAFDYGTALEYTLNSWIFGDDIIEGGKGEDKIFGDIGEVDFEQVGGDGSPQNTILNTGNSIVLGDDTLKGDDGDDYIVGDIGNASGLESLINLTVFAVSANFVPTAENNILKFGDDKLFGGNGNDILIGDISGYTNANLVTDENPFDDLYTELTWGNDELHGEAGNDRLEGNLGNDILDGGTGDDILVGGDALGPQIIPPENPGDVSDVGEAAKNYTEMQVLNNTMASAQEISRIDFGDLADAGATVENPDYFNNASLPSISITGVLTNMRYEPENPGDDGGDEQYLGDSLTDSVPNPFGVEGNFDVDIYKLHLNGGEVLSIDFDDDLPGNQVYERFDAIVLIYDQDGNFLNFLDDNLLGGADSGDLSSVDPSAGPNGTFSVEATGDYFFAVMQFDGIFPLDITGYTFNPLDFAIDYPAGAISDDPLLNDFIEPNNGTDISYQYQLSLQIAQTTTVGPPAEDDDVLTGGDGKDIFVFNLYSDDMADLGLYNHDHVTDFVLMDDKLEFNNVVDLSSDAMVTALDLDLAATVDMSGPDVVIDFAGGDAGSVTLDGASAALSGAGITEASFFADLDAAGALLINANS